MSGEAIAMAVSGHVCFTSLDELERSSTTGLAATDFDPSTPSGTWPPWS
jgi:hypothetical protein